LGWVESAAVEFDDDLDVNVRGEFFLGWLADDLSVELLWENDEPCGARTTLAFFNGAGGELLGGGTVADFELIARGGGEAGDVDLVAVNADMSMGHQLTGSGTGICETKAIDHIVETGLKDAEEIVAGDATHALSAGERETELLFGEAVHHAKLLLLIEADAVLGNLTASGLTVDARRIGATFFTLGGVEDVLTETTVQLGGRSSVAGHVFLFFV